LAKLILSRDGAIINQYFIDKPSLTIGRGQDNDIIIDDPVLSRQHARVLTVEKDQIIEDLQSSNGTLVNGRPQVRHILQHGDIIQLGSHHLRYMSARIAADADLERTMIIKGLARTAEMPEQATPIAAAPTARASKAKLPGGSIRILAGSPPASREMVALDRVVTTFGVAGEQLLVIARRPSGFFLTHVEGARFPRVNQQDIGSEPCLLRDGDLIEMADWRLEFKQEANRTDNPEETQ